ncbi:SFL1 [Candida margitis]|uniref:SFL1 n=1 Tax=Candida margitis TaxID=1775924 RepID=UPI002227D22D|nr:SFL1 [Candida margitis]KAI5967479.1 SFL1 [Candida margitis]
MSKVLHLNTTPSSEPEPTILSTWSSTSSISTLSSVATTPTSLQLAKPTLESAPMMLKAGSINDLLAGGPFQQEQKTNDSVFTNSDVALTSSGKPQIVFIHKLYDMLSNESISNLIRWAPSSNSFYVFPGENFCKVLAQYFKHTNVSSFIRQLNMYGFHKVSDNNSSASPPESKNNSRWEFRHSQNRFKKGDIESLKYIKRRSSKTINVQKEVVDLKSIPHPGGEYASMPRHSENELSPFNTHYSTPSPSQAPRNGYPSYPHQVLQAPSFPSLAPALQQPSLQLSVQHIDRSVPKLKSPLTPAQPPTNPQSANQRGPDTILALPHVHQSGSVQDYIHQRPPISTQLSFETKRTDATITEVEYWKKKHGELTADFNTLIGIIEKGTNVDVEFQKFKESIALRQSLQSHVHLEFDAPILAPQIDKATTLSSYYPQYKPKFNPPVLRQRAESKSYSPLSAAMAQKEYNQSHQQMKMDSKIPSLLVNQSQRTNSLPGVLPQQEPDRISPVVTKTSAEKRNSDSLIGAAPRLPSVNELTMNLPVFNSGLNFKRKRSS